MTRKMSTAPTVSFHDAPPDSTNQYKDVIARAKSRTVPDRPGPMENTPHFEDTQKSWENRQPQKTQLSNATAAGLSAVAEATATRQSKSAESEDIEAMPATSVSTESSTVEEDEATRLKNAVTSRITQPIDIGEYLINGEVTQLVPIIPGKLEVVFRSVTDLEESYVDSQLSKNRDATTRVFLRNSNEWALAFHIVSVNGNKWPAAVINGEIQEAAVEKRRNHVRKLSSPVFQLNTQNLVWFLERVTKGLTLEVLGNG